MLSEEGEKKCRFQNTSLFNSRGTSLVLQSFWERLDLVDDRLVLHDVRRERPRGGRGDPAGERAGLDGVDAAEEHVDVCPLDRPARVRGDEVPVVDTRGAVGKRDLRPTRLRDVQHRAVWDVVPVHGDGPERHEVERSAVAVNADRLSELGLAVVVGREARVVSAAVHGVRGRGGVVVVRDDLRARLDCARALHRTRTPLLAAQVRQRLTAPRPQRDVAARFVHGRVVPRRPEAQTPQTVDVRRGVVELQVGEGRRGRGALQIGSRDVRAVLQLCPAVAGGHDTNRRSAGERLLRGVVRARPGADVETCCGLVVCARAGAAALAGVFARRWSCWGRRLYRLRRLDVLCGNILTVLQLCPAVAGGHDTHCCAFAHGLLDGVVRARSGADVEVWRRLVVCASRRGRGARRGGALTGFLALAITDALILARAAICRGGTAVPPIRAALSGAAALDVLPTLFCNCKRGKHKE